jgi:adenine/guanine phosphoribosyltransferase-like PRPP-binding protein
MPSRPKRTFWVAGYALATQSAFPGDRLSSELYGSILGVLDGAAWSRLGTESLHVVNERTAQMGGAVVVGQLLGALQGIPAEAEVCVLDLRPAVMVADSIPEAYPRAFTRIADALWETINASEDDRHVVVIVSELGTENDPQFKRFAELVERGQATVIDTYGYCWSTRFVVPPQKTLAAAFEQAARRPAAGLSDKLIRRLGYFPRLDEDGSVYDYTRYFFDGKYCIDELTTLIGERLADIIDDGPAVVVYDEGPSSWLGPAVVQAVTGLTALHEDLDLRPALSAEQLDTEPDGDSVRTAVAVLAVVDRGNAHDRLVGRIKEWAKAARITSVCVVRIGSERSHEPGTEQRSVAGVTNVTLHHLLTERQDAVPASTFMPDVGYYDAGPHATERFMAFTSGDFWDMALEASFIRERNAPDHRRPALKRVPDLLRFVESNGAWIARKIELAILETVGAKVPDVALALVADEIAASRLSSVLSDTLGNTPLAIPRDVLTAWDEGNRRSKLLQQWATESWYHVANASQARDVVVIDEFTLSGDTLQSMASLLASMNFRIRLVLAIASFSRAEFAEKLKSYEHLALYETEWRAVESRSELEGQGATAAA